MSRIVDFYSGSAPDDQGRRIDEIWSWGGFELEGYHDYIQWLFPLPEPSKFNPDAPLLTQEIIQEFLDSEELRSRLSMSLAKMLWFYGLRLERDESGQFEVRPTPDFMERRVIWLTPGNHNHLRLTRILRCLCLLGLRPEAEALFRRLELIAGEYRTVISAQTISFWRSAVENS